MPRLSPLLLLLLTPACGRTHLQREGAYQLTATEVLQDTCGLLGRPDDLWDGTLRMAGDEVWMDLAVLQPPLTLAGVFLSGEERFTLAGTAENARVQVRDRECPADRVEVVLDADTDEEVQPPGSAFDGAIRVRVEAAGDPSCACVLAATFRAVHGASSPAGAP